MSIYMIFFDLLADFDDYLKAKDEAHIARIFKLVEWCFSQRIQSPDIWNAAATAFLEHMADKDERAALIPVWVKPGLFEEMRDEFEKRCERSGEGKFKILMDEYNQVNQTNFR